MLQVVDLHRSQKSIERGGLLFHTLTNPSQLQDESMLECDAFVVTNGPQQFEIISVIRKYPDKRCYLKPLLSQIKTQNCAFDGCFQEHDDELSAKIKIINQRISELRMEQRSIDLDESILAKCVQYMFTRNHILTPFNSRNSRVGYEWPFLNVYLEFSKSHHALSILKMGLKRGLLQSKMIDQIHLCKSCDGNYINFRETCPGCGSIDLTPKDLIHHFVCAHVAPEADFHKKDEMQCPKCDRKMRHIGIDYDKPSSVYHCNNCENQFQEPDMKGACIDCGTEQSLSDLRTEKINELSLTPKGEEFAKYGFGGEITERESGNTMSWMLFKIFARQELHRMDLKNANSFIGRLRLDSSIADGLDEHSQSEFRDEISNILKGYLLASDVLCAKNTIEYHFILTDYQQDRVLEWLSLLEDNMRKLLFDNLDDNQDSFDCQLERISTERLAKTFGT